MEAVNNNNDNSPSQYQIENNLQTEFEELPVLFTPETQAIEETEPLYYQLRSAPVVTPPAPPVTATTTLTEATPAARPRRTRRTKAQMIAYRLLNNQ